MNEIQIPNTLKIGGFDYKIAHSQKQDTELVDNDEWGTHSSRQRKICLRTNIMPQQKSATFLHECIHAIDEVYLARGINDEKVIKGLASGLLQIFEQLGVRFVKK